MVVGEHFVSYVFTFQYDHPFSNTIYSMNIFLSTKIKITACRIEGSFVRDFSWVEMQADGTTVAQLFSLNHWLGLQLSQGISGTSMVLHLLEELISS